MFNMYIDTQYFYLLSSLELFDDIMHKNDSLTNCRLPYHREINARIKCIIHPKEMNFELITTCDIVFCFP